MQGFGEVLIFEYWKYKGAEDISGGGTDLYPKVSDPWINKKWEKGKVDGCWQERAQSEAERMSNEEADHGKCGLR